MSNKSRGMCNYGSPIKRVLLLNSVGWKRSVQSPRPRLKSGNSRNCCNEIFVTSKGSNFWWLLRASGQAHAHTQTHIDWCFTLTWRLSFLFFDITFKWPPLPPPCPPQADTICVCLSCRDSFYSYSTTQHEPQHHIFIKQPSAWSVHYLRRHCQAMWLQGVITMCQTPPSRCHGRLMVKGVDSVRCPRLAAFRSQAKSELETFPAPKLTFHIKRSSF